MTSFRPRLLSAAVLVATLGAAPAYASLLTVAPGGFETTGGNAQGPTPFRFTGIGGAVGGSHVQQVYSSDFFDGFDGKRAITEIHFRASASAVPSGAFGSTIVASDIRIQLSTTSRGDEGPRQLSTTFADNVGADARTVYSGALTLATAAAGTSPNPFDYTIMLQNPFVYDPALGNLLLDVLLPVSAKLTSNGVFGFTAFDQVNTLNDGIYSVLNINSGGTATGFGSTAGTITRFVSEVVAVPEPGSLALFGGGLIGLTALRRRRRT